LLIIVECENIKWNYAYLIGLRAHCPLDTPFQKGIRIGTQYVQELLYMKNSVPEQITYPAIEPNYPNSLPFVHQATLQPKY
jgi:hypothetical protein